MTEELFPTDSGGKPEPRPESTPLPEVVLLPRWRLRPRPSQMRKEFDPQKVRALAESIRMLREKGQGRGKTGILQPLEVTWEAGAINEDGTIKPSAKALINMGETRWRATAEAGFSDDDPVPVAFASADEKQAYENGMIENLFRSDPTPVEIAHALRVWMNTFSPPLSMLKAAKKLGRTKSWVQHYLELLGLPDDLQDMIDKRTDSVLAARRIKTIPDINVRAELKAFYLAGGTSDEVNRRIARWKEKQKELAQSSEEAPIPAPTESGEVEQMQFGSPPPDVLLIPKIDIVAAMDDGIRRLQSAHDALQGVNGRLMADRRRAVQARLQLLKELTRQMEEELHANMRGKGAKKRSEKPPESEGPE